VEKDKLNGWIGTIIIHALLIILFALMHVSLDVELPEFVEVSWGTMTRQEPARPQQQPQVTRAEREPVIAQRREAPATQRPVELPERRELQQDDDIIRLPERDRVDVAQRLSEERQQDPDEMRERRERDAGSILGERDRFQLPATEDEHGESPLTTGSSPHQTDTDRDISYALEWIGDVTRKKVSGALPEYPAGANVEAVIRLRATVFPDGSVKAVHPVQRGNPRLEDAAQSAVRYWRFEPLSRTQPQVEQDCFITFHFTLQ
jgi:TonB family protein